MSNPHPKKTTGSNPAPGAIPEGPLGASIPYPMPADTAGARPVVSDSLGVLPSLLTTPALNLDQLPHGLDSIKPGTPTTPLLSPNPKSRQDSLGFIYGSPISELQPGRKPTKTEVVNFPSLQYTSSLAKTQYCGVN